MRIRKAFLMHVHPGREAEYERRHQPIWPELAAVLKEHGVHHYSIFREAGSGRCFACVEIEDEVRWQAIAQTEVCQRWWKSMAPLMAVNPDLSPVATELPEVFYLE